MDSVIDGDMEGELDGKDDSDGWNDNAPVGMIAGIMLGSLEVLVEKATEVGEVVRDGSWDRVGLGRLMEKG